jgi:tripeptidyl-peptidase-1
VADDANMKSRYQIPRHIQKHIDYISPGIKLSAPPLPSNSRKHGFSAKKLASRLAAIKSPSGAIGADSLSTCDVVMTPQCIVALYGIPPGEKFIPGNNLSIYKRGDYVDGTSLDLFFANFTEIP